ncbi:interleukin-13 receptor subunit alpha-2 [Bombina bombina]|uniref:interleukin-13 receptor subunit alpha-2 n=1 Tax=Bombina bombina TaxID=8345 RepID=UPI00235AFBBF|nr:interleukin-13 receptor subunit alpha-2 [Bombina bombina]
MRNAKWIIGSTSGLQTLYRVILQSTVCLICLNATMKASAHSISVDPPSNLTISDPGFLGVLDIKWNPPNTAATSIQCKVLYELVYKNVATNHWKVIQTRTINHRAAFNLSEVIEVKIRSFLKGPCTNGSQVWSEWVKTQYSVPLQGNPESQIESFRCVYYNWENLTCFWVPGKLFDHHSNYELHYWHEGLSHIKSCPTYLKHNRIHTGCVFKDQLKSYTNVFLRVIGIPSLSPIRSSYFILQIQDIVKPAPPEMLSVSKINADFIQIEWKPPQGKVPPGCLKYEIQYQDHHGAWKSAEEQRETSRNISSDSTCAQVKGKVNMYCAKDGFWSEWNTHCWKEKIPVEIPYMQYFLVGGSILILVFLSIGILFWAYRTKIKVLPKK